MSAPKMAREPTSRGHATHEETHYSNLNALEAVDSPTDLHSELQSPPACSPRRAPRTCPNSRPAHSWRAGRYTTHTHPQHPNKHDHNQAAGGAARAAAALSRQKESAQRGATEERRHSLLASLAARPSPSPLLSAPLCSLTWTILPLGPFQAVWQHAYTPTPAALQLTA